MRVGRVPIGLAVMDSVTRTQLGNYSILPISAVQEKVPYMNSSLSEPLFIFLSARTFAGLLFLTLGRDVDLDLSNTLIFLMY